MMRLTSRTIDRMHQFGLGNAVLLIARREFFNPTVNTLFILTRVKS